MPIPVALLDANVLYPAPLRDFLLQLAYDDFFEPKWSEEIQNEWTRNLLANRSDLTAAQLARTRDAMERAFPAACVVGYEPRIPTLANHPKDRHVLAAAIEGNARFLVTLNQKDFPVSALVPWKIDAILPDDFALALCQKTPSDVVSMVRRHRARLTKPQKSPTEYLDSLERCGLLATVEWLRKRAEDL